MAFPPGCDRTKLAEVGMAMLFLTAHAGGTRAGNHLDPELLLLMYQRDWITDPRKGGKNLGFTEKGFRLAAELFQKHFTTPKE